MSTPSTYIFQLQYGYSLFEERPTYPGCLQPIISFWAVSPYLGPALPWSRRSCRAWSDLRHRHMLPNDTGESCKKSRLLQLVSIFKSSWGSPIRYVGSVYRFDGNGVIYAIPMWICSINRLNLPTGTIPVSIFETPASK